jgi:carbon-monoxide dehydrogenase large subunit/6-hydroxypseudooxynicotine dehydrogenase subunit gamma
MTSVGTRVRRAEDPRLLTGRGRFVDDVELPGMLHMRVVRSTSAHGRLRGVDCSAARSVPGVAAVLTAGDFAEVPRIPVRLAASSPGQHQWQRDPLLLQPILATGVVRYVGEPLAVVVADDPYVAEDAAELVVVDIEELTPLVEAHPDTEGESEVACLSAGYGDVDAALRSAAHIVRAELKCGRHAAVPLECRGMVAHQDDGRGRLELWGPTKVPNFCRRVIAQHLGIPLHQIHVNAVDAGGGFGARGEVYPEDVLVPYMARLLHRPVKWIEDRNEHLMSSNQSREQLHRIEAGFDTDGHLVALRDEIWHDNGAYLRTHGVVVPELTITMLPGPYRVPAYAGSIHVVLTNKTPCGTYRAPGRYEGTFAREHLLDVAADQLGIDRIELRRRNLLTVAELPHTRPISALGTDMVLDAGDYHGLLDAALQHFGFEEWKAGAQSKCGEGCVVGVGAAFFLEKSGLGPFDTATVEVDSSGAARVVTGGTSLGQGIETVMGQIAADELGLEPADVQVLHSDSDLSPDGTGSWASRSTVLSGSAVLKAARAVAQQARHVAGVLLEAHPDDLHLHDGRVSMRSNPDVGVSLGQVADACRPGGAGWSSDATGVGLRAGAIFETSHMTYPYGLHLACVEVDVETGMVRVVRYAVAYEVGRAINPQLVEGQLRGGAAQGIGGALLEEFTYGPDGQPTSTSFIDYMLPTAAEVPPVETLILEMSPAPGNPLGARGAGEGGITACGAAVANAVRDALDLTGPLPGLPLTPSAVSRCRRSTFVGAPGGQQSATENGHV